MSLARFPSSPFYNKGTLFPTIRFLIREPEKTKGKRVLLGNLVGVLG